MSNWRCLHRWPAVPLLLILIDSPATLGIELLEGWAGSLDCWTLYWLVLLRLENTLWRFSRVDLRNRTRLFLHSMHPRDRPSCAKIAAWMGLGLRFLLLECI